MHADIRRRFDEQPSRAIGPSVSRAFPRADVELLVRDDDGFHGDRCCGVRCRFHHCFARLDLDLRLCVVSPIFVSSQHFW